MRCDYVIAVQNLQDFLNRLGIHLKTPSPRSLRTDSYWKQINYILADYNLRNFSFTWTNWKELLLIVSSAYKTSWAIDLVDSQLQVDREQ